MRGEHYGRGGGRYTCPLAKSRFNVRHVPHDLVSAPPAFLTVRRPGGRTAPHPPILDADAFPPHGRRGLWSDPPRQYAPAPLLLSDQLSVISEQ